MDRSPSIRAAPLRALLLALAAAGLVGCGKPEPAPDPLKAQRSALQKAKAVNDVVTGAADEKRKEIEDAETK